MNDALDGASRGYSSLTAAEKKPFLPWTEYVYLWVCSIGADAYVKVGVTNNPDRRATEFRTNSPLKPTRHLICQCPTRDAALSLEAHILDSYSMFATKGEWIQVPDDLVEGLVAACSKIAKRQVSPETGFRFYRPKIKRNPIRARTATGQT